jgi:alanine racemase
VRIPFTATAPVLQLREVPADTPVGYGGGSVTTRPTRIATVAAGYADGIPRAISGRGMVALFGGRPAPLIGRVSMDLTLFDVTDLPRAPVPGEAATLIGDAPGITPDEIADRAGTIGYEVLTSLGSRWRRVYRGGGVAPGAA